MFPPDSITPAVRGFARFLTNSRDINLDWVPCRPPQEAEHSDCFNIVADHIVRHGGSLADGWAIIHWPQVWLEAEFHGVWRAPNGELTDLTPRLGPQWQSTLFLHEPKRVYEGRQVKAIVRPLSDDPDVRRLIAAQKELFELLNEGDLADQHLVAVDGFKHARIQSQIAEHTIRLLERYPHPRLRSPN